MLERLSTALHLENIGPTALLDMAVLAILVYQFLLLVRGTRAARMIAGVVSLVLAHLLTGPGLFFLPAVHAVLGMLLLYAPFAIIVLFQNPIRQALVRAGRNPLSSLLPRARHEELAEEVALAAAALGSKRTGALIVIEREMGLRAFAETGIALDAVVSYDLLMNLFTRGSPLHDGAVIIAEGRIRAASCYLPLTTKPDLSRTYGTRHRAAAGITEESDAIAVVVSEERGVVSIAEAGTIVEGLDARSLRERLRAALTPREEQGLARKRTRLVFSRSRDV
jgi:diadenylate cyclase